jgi:hypothetical protein
MESSFFSLKRSKLELHHPTENQVYEINRNILQHKEWAVVFSVQDIFIFVPPGQNRFVLIWAVISFHVFRTPYWICHNIISLGKWTVFNDDRQLWVTEAIQFLNWIHDMQLLHFLIQKTYLQYNNIRIF